MKTGIFGGAFDPVHNGHIRLVVCAAREYSLDRLILLPTGIPPHKALLNASGEHRVKLLEIACDTIRREVDIPVIIDERELYSKETSYTYVTLEGFHRDYPEDELYFIMGGDSIEHFNQWVKPDVIASLAVILAGRRKEVDEERIKSLVEEYAVTLNADIRLVGSPEIDISSTELRKMLKDLPYGKYESYEVMMKSSDFSNIPKALNDYLSKKTLEYIYEHDMYRI